MVKFPFPTSSMKCAMSVAALPGGMLGAHSRLRPLPLSLVGWCASCNNTVHKDLFHGRFVVAHIIFFRLNQFQVSLELTELQFTTGKLLILSTILIIPLLIRNISRNGVRIMFVIYSGFAKNMRPP